MGRGEAPCLEKEWEAEERACKRQAADTKRRRSEECPCSRNYCSGDATGFLHGSQRARGGESKRESQQKEEMAQGFHFDPLQRPALFSAGQELPWQSPLRRGLSLLERFQCPLWAERRARPPSPAAPAARRRLEVRRGPAGAEADSAEGKGPPPAAVYRASRANPTSCLRKEGARYLKKSTVTAVQRMRCLMACGPAQHSLYQASNLREALLEKLASSWELGELHRRPMTLETRSPSPPSRQGTDMTPVEELKGFSNADVLVKPTQRRRAKPETQAPQGLRVLPVQARANQWCSSRDPGECHSPGGMCV